MSNTKMGGWVKFETFFGPNLKDFWAIWGGLLLPNVVLVYEIVILSAKF